VEVVTGRHGFHNDKNIATHRPANTKTISHNHEGMALDVVAVLGRSETPLGALPNTNIPLLF
jgi:hypothetical protein